MRKIICWLFGHRRICVKRDQVRRYNVFWTESTAWLCESCGGVSYEDFQ